MVSMPAGVLSGLRGAWRRRFFAALPVSERALSCATGRGSHSWSAAWLFWSATSLAILLQLTWAQPPAWGLAGSMTASARLAQPVGGLGRFRCRTPLQDCFHSEHW